MKFSSIQTDVKDAIRFFKSFTLEQTGKNINL